jgi:hypothetical protein
MRSALEERGERRGDVCSSEGDDVVVRSIPCDDRHVEGVSATQTMLVAWLLLMPSPPT